MLALSVAPQQPGSARVDEWPAPDAHRPEESRVLLRALDIGICGTDREIVDGRYGTAPPGEPRLVIGHESLGEVLEAPPGGGVEAGALAVAIVRRPDPVPCAACARGRWDMCKNGQYTERGIRGRHGYAAQRYMVRPEFLIPVPARLRGAGVLIEPASVVAKAWEQVERIAARAGLNPRVALVTGAGPIGLLAALLGRQRGLEVHVFDRATGGPKPGLARALGAHYHHGDIARLALQPDVVVECTGATPLIVDAATRMAPDGIVCLTGVSSGGRRIGVDIGALNRDLVLENGVIFGSVNAARGHYEAALGALERADPAWLEAMISRRVPLARWQEAFAPAEDDVKVVLDFSGPSRPSLASGALGLLPGGPSRAH